MSARASHEGKPRTGSKGSHGLFAPEFLRILTVLSVVPVYLIGGALVGYLLDRMLGTFPFLTAAGLLAALVLCVRDLLRLRDEFRREPADDDSA